MCIRDRRNADPYTDRPNAHLEPIDFDTEYAAFRKKFQKGFSRPIEFEDFLSYSLYPRVFEQAHEKYKLYGNLAILPTKNFFYGMKLREEAIIELEEGKTIIVKLLSVGIPNDEGIRIVFFSVNGENRFVEIKDKSIKVEKEVHIPADPEDANQYGAPLQGMLYKMLVKKGQEIEENEPLFVIEAMKMETTVTANKAGKVKSITLKPGTMLMKGDLVVTVD